MTQARSPRGDSISAPWAIIGLMAVLLTTSACQSIQPKRDSGTVTLARELAETQRQVEEMTHRLSVLQFMLDSHERALADLERNTAPSPAPLPTTPVTPFVTEEAVKPPLPRPKKSAAAKKAKGTRQKNLASQTYTQAFAAMNKKEYDKALILFREIAEKWPTDNLADNAIYWSGEIHYTKKDYSAAIGAFRSLLNKYPKGSKAPDALLKTGYAFISLKDKESARTYLKRAVMEYPFTVSGAKAEKALNALDKN